MTRTRGPARALIPVALVVLALAAPARADPDPDPGPDPGDARLRAATLQDAAGDHTGALAAMVAIADQLPDSPWADAALAAAARIAERDGDPLRAAALLTRLATTYPTSRSAAWARAHADELTRNAGDVRWRAVAAEHDAVIAAIGRYGDPKPQLARLARLIAANPGYPRATAARLWLGDRWGPQGYWDRALGFYRDAEASATTGAERRIARLGAAATLTALERFSDAEAELARLAADPDVDPIALERARADVDRMRGRHRWRIAAWIALAVLAAAAAIAIRRATGSLAAAARAIARPPIEAWFLVPVAAIVIAVSATGNALVASGVRWIGIGGVIVTWISGAVVATAPAPPRWRIAVHLAAVTLAALAVVYLAVSRDRLLDLLIETWHNGPEQR